jgi:tetratricopeptide (TPR) repeat protein
MGKTKGIRRQETGELKIWNRGILFLVAVFFLVGCSSAPKPPSEIVTERNTAAKQLNLANHTASRGRYNDALVILEDAWRLAASTDDPPLRIKTSISRGSILFSLDRYEEAFAAWDKAASEGDSSGEKILAALARIYTIRARIVQLENKTGGTDIKELTDKLDAQMTAVRSDSHATAAAYVTLGLAEKHTGRWADAEKALKQALAIHEKDLLLEDAGYDWFIIGSVRSMAGNYDSALEALGMAISFDRRAENGFGLASSWQAIGDVYQKAGRVEDSRSARSRASEIFRAIGLDDKAEQLERQLSF